MGTTVDTSFVERLADDASLKLPGSLTGNENEPVSRSKKFEYLQALLTRDAGVFLERHGEHLHTEDLAYFDDLRKADYEVDFYLRQMSAQVEPAQPRLTPLIRNRRLAKLNRLVKEGEFFSDEAMRQRQPLLHHQYVGQYREAVPAAWTPAEGHPLSSSILQDVDEGHTRERFEAQREAQNAIEEESSDEEAYPEDRRAEVQQHSREPCPEGGDGQPGPSTEGADATTTQKPQSGDAGEEEAENQPEAAQFVRIPDDERAQLQSDFLELMHQRFLAGEEDDVDYVQIDACAALDEDFAAERQQDAEDAYFDSVE